MQTPTSRLLCALALASAPVPATVSAATRTWDGGGADNRWNTAQNWAGDVAPVSGDALVFPAGAAQLANQNNITLPSLVGITVQEGGYVLSGSNIRLQGNLACTHSSGVVTVNTPVALSGATTFSTATSGTSLSIGGPLTMDGHQLTIHSVATTGITCNSNAPIAGSSGGSVVKTGPGNFTLQSGGTFLPNLFNGPYDVQEGTLTVMHPQALGTTDVGTTMAAGTTLRLDLPPNSTTFSEPVTLGGVLDSGRTPTADTTTLDGAWHLTGAATDITVRAVTQSGTLLATTLSFAGTVTQTTGSSTMRKLGLGTLRFAHGGDLAFSGVTVQEGTLELAKPSGAVTAAFTVGSFTGLAGQDTLRWLASDQLGATSTLNLGTTTGIADLGAHTQTLASLDLAPGRFSVVVAGTVPGEGHGRFTVNGPVNVTDATLTLTGTDPFVALPGTEITLIDNDGSDTVVGTFSGMPEGTPLAVGHTTCALSYVGGTGNDVTLTVTSIDGATRVWDGGGANNNWMTAANWDGNSLPDAGDALVFPAGAARPSSVNNFPAGTAFRSLRFEASGYELSGNAIVLHTGVEAAQPSGSSTLGLPVTLALPQTWTIDEGTLDTTTLATIDNGGHTLTFYATTGNEVTQAILRAPVSGGGGLVKTGPGRIALTEANTYGGQTIIQEGTVTVQQNAALGTTSSGTTLGAGATLVLTGSANSVAEPLVFNGGLVRPVTGTFVLSGSILLGTPATTTLDLANGALTLTGAVTGDGGLRKTGENTLIVGGSAANSFLGGFTSEGGLTLLQKPAGTAALRGAIDLVGGTAPATELRLAAANQIENLATVSLEGSLAVFDTAGFDETIAAVDLTAGSVLTGAGTLTLTDGVITHPAAQAALIGGNISLRPADKHSWDIADGTPVVDLLVTAVVSGLPDSILVKKGAGRVDFLADNALGEFVVAEGELIMNGSNATTTVRLAGGLLGGTGNVEKIVPDGGGQPSTVAPGTKSGVFGTQGFAFDRHTILRMELDGSNPGNDYDQLACAGDYDLGGATLELLLGFTPAVGTTFTLVESSGGTPTANPFLNFPPGAHLSLPGGVILGIDYKANDGDDVTVTRVAETPPTIRSWSITPATGANAGNNVFELQIGGMSGLSYGLEASEDLETWTPVADAVADAEGAAAFTFLSPVSLTRRFIRATRR